MAIGAVTVNVNVCVNPVLSTSRLDGAKVPAVNDDSLTVVVR